MDFIVKMMDFIVKLEFMLNCSGQALGTHAGPYKFHQKCQFSRFFLLKMQKGRGIARVK